MTGRRRKFKQLHRPAGTKVHGKDACKTPARGMFHSMRSVTLNAQLPAKASWVSLTPGDNKQWVISGMELGYIKSLTSLQYPV